MSKEQVNQYLKDRIGYSTNQEIEELRDVYKSVIKKDDEKDFYYSVCSWFFDGCYSYYDRYLLRVWRDENVK